MKIWCLMAITEEEARASIGKEVWGLRDSAFKFSPVLLGLLQGVDFVGSHADVQTDEGIYPIDSVYLRYARAAWVSKMLTQQRRRRFWKFWTNINTE